jgi:molybdenum ABC transporter, periplasmic molybdate-binding protein
MPARTIVLHIVSVLMLVVCTSASAFAQPKRIRVAAASDLQAAMPEIAKAFEAKTGITVELIFGSSGNFFSQIQNGAPFDLFFSADSEFPANLIQSGRAEPRSAVVYGVGSLVLWMPPSAICDPQAEKWNCLLKPQVSRIAIANPAHAPYGRAAVSALQSAHIYKQVLSKLVFGENISQAAQFAQSGNAQAGILAYSLAHSSAMREGKLWDIPLDSYPPIEQTVVVLKAAKEKSAARDFVLFVTEGPGHALLAQFSLRPASAQTPAGRHK